MYFKSTMLVFNVHVIEVQNVSNHVYPCSSISKFSDFVQNLLPREGIMANTKGNVFEYFLDMKTLQFVPWKERRQERTEQGKGSTRYVQLPEVCCRHVHWLYLHSYMYCKLYMLLFALKLIEFWQNFFKPPVIHVYNSPQKCGRCTKQCAFPYKFNTCGV